LPFNAHDFLVGHVLGLKTKDIMTRKDEIVRLLSAKSLELPRRLNLAIGDVDNSDERTTLLNKVAERETLVTLMAAIETAMTRKTMILEALEKCNTLLVTNLPFGESPETSTSPPRHVEQHYAWLLANLEQTNQSLEVGRAHLRIMYSEGYYNM
jgi:hypothetical protein